MPREFFCRISKNLTQVWHSRELLDGCRPFVAYTGSVRRAGKGGSRSLATKIHSAGASSFSHGLVAVLPADAIPFGQSEAILVVRETVEEVGGRVLIRGESGTGKPDLPAKNP